MRQRSLLLVASERTHRKQFSRVMTNIPTLFPCHCPTRPILSRSPSLFLLSKTLHDVVDFKFETRVVVSRASDIMQYYLFDPSPTLINGEQHRILHDNGLILMLRTCQVSYQISATKIKIIRLSSLLITFYF